MTACYPSFWCEITGYTSLGQRLIPEDILICDQKYDQIFEIAEWVDFQV